MVKSSSASPNKLDPQNFVGPVYSLVSLAKAGNTPGNSIEWVREDLNNLQFLVPPGAYYVEMIENDQFVVDQLKIVDEEQLLSRSR